MILFERKFERARKFQREQNEARKSDCTGRDDLELTDVMEKGDTLAMIIAGLITILPAAIVTLVILAEAGYFFIMR